MARYGAKCPMFAPFATTNPETDTAYPTYGDAVTLAELVQFVDAPNYIDVKLYGDDRVVENVVEFKDGTGDLEITEMSGDNAKIIFGAKSPTGSTGDASDIMYGADDVAPYGGFAFYVSKMVNNVKSYQGIYYPKVKAIPQGVTYDTKGDNITFATSKLRFNIYAPAYGKWKVESGSLTSESAAVAWVKAKLGVSAS